MQTDPYRAYCAAPFPWLVADIGGTYARFGLWTETGVQQVRKIPVREFNGPAEAAQAYLSGIALQSNGFYRAPRAAAFAVATAVVSDRVDLTNSHWNFSQAAVRNALDLDVFVVLNDFEALALSLPQLQPSQLRAHGPFPTAGDTLAVIGPGTGLGVASVIPTPSGWVALPGEGGHATLAAADDFESTLLAHVRRDYPHVSAERLLSGIGLPVLHHALVKMAGGSTDMLPAESIVERGMTETDPVCMQTLDVFCALLGSFAGNVALTLGARGGVYIGGGIVPRLGERFFTSTFRERFEAKGRFRSYLEQIPTALITDTLAALTGAAVAIEQHRTEPGPRPVQQCA